MMRTLSIALIVLTLGGCTGEQLYGMGQSYRRNLCDEYIGADRQRCLAQANRTYSEYEQGLPAKDAPK